MKQTKVFKGGLYAVLILSMLMSTVAGTGLYASVTTWNNCWNGYQWVTPINGYCPTYNYNYGSYPSYTYDAGYNNYNSGVIYTQENNEHYEYTYTTYPVVTNTNTNTYHPQGSTQGSCGDGLCSLSESEHSCPADCRTAAYCGDGLCSAGETQSTCPYDCGYETQTPTFYCGDGICRGTETKNNCPDDCGLADYCGDGECNGADTKQNCPQDCGLPNFCGDGVCNRDESKLNCPYDCGLADYCGDGTCNGDETKYSCSLDCGTPKCGDPTGKEGDKICEGRQKLVCDSGFWEFDRSVDCCNDKDCGPGAVCQNNVCTIRTVCGDGVCLDDENVCNCPVDCHGDVSICRAPEPTCGSCNTPTCNTCPPPLPPQPQNYCGDGSCNNGETCSTCQTDCGQCSYCGDGICDISRGENQNTCSEDCGEPTRHVIILSTSEECMEIERGDIGTFILAASNSGDVYESLTLARTGSAAVWASQVPSVSVAQGDIEDWDLEVSVPANADPGLYNITVRANNADVSEEITVFVDVTLTPFESGNTTSGTTTGGDTTDGTSATGAAVGIEIPSWVFVLVLIGIFILFVAMLLGASSSRTTVRRRVISISPKAELTPDGGSVIRIIRK